MAGVDQEEAFLAGLFHDIGKVIMNNHDRAKFQSVMERCYNEELLFTEAEKLVYPYTHEQVGSLVIKKWNFPQSLTESVLHHHTFAFTDLSDMSLLNLTSVVNLADQFCLKLGIGQRCPMEDLPLAGTKAVGFLGLDDEKVNRLLDDFRAAYETDTSSLTAAS